MSEEILKIRNSKSSKSDKLGFKRPRGNRNLDLDIIDDEEEDEEDEEELGEEEGEDNSDEKNNREGKARKTAFRLPVLTRKENKKRNGRPKRK